ncbi:restriction endonuclease [Marinobacterium iners]|uniref:Restriction endonuclease n=1 Tax=Marinobacterium iners DSM 11526 TaxID=1122198 RepID=A0A1H4F261_9GAMM|nr:restriction endonuclease [Marinobacterium iners]SEA91301.1 Restriction endonuclease [Marinobacterium iners DSM 11526]
MSFPSDIKGAMRDCILKLLWPKKDIVQFFSDNGCTKADITAIGSTQESHRSKLVDNMFAHLSSKSDGGLGPFRAMLQALTNWSQFDPYYFERLGKLNRGEAERSITHLKQLQEIRDHKLREEKKAREAKEAEAKNPKKTLTDLKNRFIELLQGAASPNRRGYELEEILQELGKISKLEITEPYRVNGEQIDGAVKFEGEHYLVEAKWQDKASSNEPVYQFAGKVEGKLYGRGIFISVNGFSENVVSSLVYGKAIKTIFVDGEDLMMVLEGLQTFSDMLDKKVKAAQTKGFIYINAITCKNKIS